MVKWELKSMSDNTGKQIFSCWMMDLTGFNEQTACYHYD